VAACEAPRIPPDRHNLLTKALGGESFQMDPSSVVARLTFAGPDEAPVVETVYVGGDKRYAERIVAEASLLRAPCATASAPISSNQLYRTSVTYMFYSNPLRRVSEPRLKFDLKLADVVRLVKDLKTQSVRFDFREMGCPFNVRVAPFRPYLPNEVEEVGNKNPSRAPLLAWLRTVTLDIPGDMMVTAIGRESLVAVPCAVLDLS
jgi:hypothetical protein